MKKIYIEKMIEHLIVDSEYKTQFEELDIWSEMDESHWNRLLNAKPEFQEIYDTYHKTNFIHGKYIHNAENKDPLSRWIYRIIEYIELHY